MKAFTIVELLIVMAILAVLMTIGIVVGRFAIQTANNIQHQNAVEQISEAIIAYHKDFRRYPSTITDDGNSPIDGVLAGYFDEEFDGGAPASFYYDTDSIQQAYVICVTLGGENDKDQLGVYCTGTGYKEGEVLGNTVLQQMNKSNDGGLEIVNASASMARSTAFWDGKAWDNITNTPHE